MADRRRANPDANKAEAAESFVERWSRRKHAAERERTPPADAEQQPAAASPAADEGPADADLPSPDTLGPDSDYSAYLSSRVSEGLRRAALRKLFGQPEFNVRDGLDDYDDDYRSFAKLGDIVTADMRHHEERLREKERLRQQAAGDEQAAPEPMPGTEPEPVEDPAAEDGPGEERTQAQGGAAEQPGEPDPGEDPDHA